MQKRILLMLLPFWDSQIPPLGISCLKSYLNENGDFNVKTVDLNTNERISVILDKYFKTIKLFVPENKRRHLQNIVYEVLQNHLMAFNNRSKMDEYYKLLKIVVYKTFYTHLSEIEIKNLDNIVKEYYLILKKESNSIIDSFKPDIVGLSIYNGTLPSSLYVLKEIKRNYNDILTVVGGGIFAGNLTIDSPNFQRFIEFSDNIDKIIIGEGEELFLQLVYDKLPKSQKVFNSVKYFHQNKCLNEYPIPDYSDFDLDNYLNVATYTSRSCPYECSFCVETVFWGKYRKKSEKVISEEMNQLYKIHKKQLFVMCDSLLNPVIKKLTSYNRENEVPVYFDGYFRIDKDSMNITNTLLWRKGGFYRARLGVESGSQRILEKMNKKISIPEIKSAISSLAYAGIKTSTMWVIGHPEESEEDFQDTLNLIEELKDDIYEADCNPFWYFYSGQRDSDKWSKYRIPLYPEKFNDLLGIQSWTLNYEPLREAAYKRVNEFIDFCSKLGIPNPYKLKDIINADNRWKKLHKNSVPSIIDFNTKSIVPDKGKIIKEKYTTSKEINLEDEWDF